MGLLESIKTMLRPREPQPEIAASRATLAFSDISEPPVYSLVPLLDQPDIDESELTDLQKAWRNNGYVILPRFLPDDLIEGYASRRAKLAKTGGWKIPTPYQHVVELRTLALHPPLMGILKELIGEEALLHLALTGWVSTERDWHQDDYLNPSFVNSWYAAVWFALDDIHPDAGPFEFIAGSHKWPLLRGDLVRNFMTAEELADFDSWPSTSQAFVAPAMQREIIERGVPSEKFIARKGDVLIWHGRLMHRGSTPRDPEKMRKALICHYSGLSHRPDMPDREQDANGNWYALFDYRLDE